MKIVSEKEIARKLGKRIVELRRLNKMSQADLSYEAEIDLSTLSRAERGIQNITLSVLCKISVALKTTVKELFNFSDSK